ncbi:hypothetical protein GMDG_05066 [Pseudogymnoascus destructans 20631-21]|uniref:Uncharacterized protein n=1 Tax=Pseudogymnoascus destructans (strain ATCC MYA-4855 / 20631-21) TaxID=658429 RepID=L8FMW6_PSED2|nr:hypothetical protein GMDG_05066 [Pseudogymnoascus destructans 20631-21]
MPYIYKGLIRVLSPHYREKSTSVVAAVARKFIPLSSNTFPSNIPITPPLRLWADPNTHRTTPMVRMRSVLEIYVSDDIRGLQNGGIGGADQDSEESFAESAHETIYIR